MRWPPSSPGSRPAWQSFLEAESNVDAATRESWIELARLSPRGFKLDEPTVDVYRGRLTALARSLAADIGTAR